MRTLSSPDVVHVEKDRAALRWTQVYKSAGATVLGRAVSMLCTLAQVPIALHYLGKESFGLWITLTGVVAMLNFADLGIGLGMQNKISAAYGRDDMAQAREIFLTGFALLAAVALAVFGIGCSIGWGLDWASFFKIEAVELRPHVRDGLLVVFAAFCLGIPLSAAQKLAVALQLGWLQALGGLVGSIISLILVACAALLKLTIVPFLAVAVLPPVLVNLGLLQRLFVRLNWRFAMEGRAARPHVREIFRAGTLFLIPQIASTMVVSAPAVILSSMLGAAAVVPFNLTQRLLGMICQLQGVFIGPLWPAYAEAQARGDHQWIRQAFRRSLFYSLFSAILPCLVFGFIGRPLILLWTQRPEALPSPQLLWFLCLWSMVTAAGAPCAMFLNGLGRLAGQAIYGTTTAVLSLVLMPIMTQRAGAAGIPLALILAYVPINLLLACCECRHALKKLRH